MSDLAQEPELVVHVRLEGGAVAWTFASDLDGERRLLVDLERRTDLPGELARAAAMEIERMRAGRARFPGL